MGLVFFGKVEKQKTMQSEWLHEFHSEFVVSLYNFSSLFFPPSLKVFWEYKKNPGKGKTFFPSMINLAPTGGEEKAAAEFQYILPKIFCLKNKRAKTEEPLMPEKSLFL